MLSPPLHWSVSVSIPQLAQKTLVSCAMLPLQSIEASPPSNHADENGEIRQQKPKALPCKYCSKRFRSVTITTTPSGSSSRILAYIDLSY